MIITAGISFYCTKEEPREEFCNCKNPINDLHWLRNIVKQYKKTPGLYRCISQCTYDDGIEGFYIYPLGLSDINITLFDYEGNIL